MIKITRYPSTLYLLGQMEYINNVNCGLFMSYDLHHYLIEDKHLSQSSLFKYDFYTQRNFYESESVDHEAIVKANKSGGIVFVDEDDVKNFDDWITKYIRLYYTRKLYSNKQYIKPKNPINKDIFYHALDAIESKNIEKFGNCVESYHKYYDFYDNDDFQNKLAGAYSSTRLINTHLRLVIAEPSAHEQISAEKIFLNFKVDFLGDCEQYM